MSLTRKKRACPSRSEVLVMIEINIFLGKTKTKLDIYQPKNDLYEIKSTEKIEEQINSIQVTDVTESKELCIKVIEEIIQGYMQLVKSSLENYGDYLPVFNYKHKKL